MSAARRAFVFYFASVIANRVVEGLRRLRRPRYLIGAVLVALYLGWSLLQFGYLTRRGDVASRTTEAVVTGLIMFQFFTAWAFSGWSRALAFRESEVEILFQAPLSRRTLLAFKWCQSQVQILVFALVFAVILGRGTRFVFAAPALFVIGNLSTLHSGFAALAVQRARAAGFRFLGGVVAGIYGAVLIVAFQRAWRDAGADGGLREVFTHPAVGTVAAPNGRAIAANGAATASEFGASILLPLGIVVVLAFLVLRMDVAFEDAAVRLAGRLTRMRREGAAALRSPKSQVVPANHKPLFALQPTGPLWVAFVWKNLIGIGRASRSGLLVMGAIIVALVALGALGPRADLSPNLVIAVGLALFAPYTAILGPAMVRIDLRMDIPHFDVLRALPIRGRELIFGEVAATTSVLIAAQSIMLAAAAVLVGERTLGEFTLTPGLRVAAVVGGTLALAGLDFVIVTLENAMALFFPGFVRLGRSVKTGLHNFGQQLIGALFRVLALIFVVIPPALGTSAVIVVTYRTAGAAAATLFGGAVFGVVIAVEALLVILLTEGRYDAFDLSSEILEESE